MLLCTLLAVQRSFAVEAADGARDGLRLSGLDPAGIFLGKAAAIAIQLVALEVLLGIGVVVLFGADLQDPGLLVATAAAATLGLAAAGTVYGMMAAGLRVRETLCRCWSCPWLRPSCSAPPRRGWPPWPCPPPTAGSGLSCWRASRPSI